MRGVFKVLLNFRYLVGCVGIIPDDRRNLPCALTCWVPVGVLVWTSHRITPQNLMVLLLWRGYLCGGRATSGFGGALMKATIRRRNMERGESSVATAFPFFC